MKENRKYASSGIKELNKVEKIEKRQKQARKEEEGGCFPSNGEKMGGGRSTARWNTKVMGYAGRAVDGERSSKKTEDK